MTHRSRAWRRAQRRKHGGYTYTPAPKACWQEKRWALLYFRSAKLKRAQTLGRFWPYKEWESLLQDAEPIKLLFVCSMNQWRSPTGEAVFRKDPGVDVRSAGTSSRAKRTISVTDIRWADMILVMEDKHYARLRAQFRGEVRYKTVHVLDIPDDYRFMDTDLIDILRAKVAPLIRDA